jgi:DNA processing protein
VAVTRVEEVIEDLGRIGADLAPVRPHETRPLDLLSRRQSAVISTLPARRPLPADEVARRCGLEPAEATAELGQLALLGMVERIDGGWRPTRLGRGNPRSA